MIEQADIDLATLRAAVAVEDCMSYTRAAQQLGVSQPAISKRIVALEQRLRTKLFRRDGQRFLPTEAGTALCQRAREILGLVEGLPQTVLDFAEHPTGTVRLGVPPNIGERLLPAVIPAYRERYPQVAIRIEQGYVADLLELLIAKSVDIAVLYGDFQAPAVELITFAALELGILYPAAWSSAAPLGWPIDEALPLKRIAELPLIAPSPEQSMRQLIDRTFHAVGLRPNVILEVNSMILQKSLARTGMGCMFMTERIAAEDDGHLRYARISDASMKWPLSMAVRRNGSTTLATRLMMRMMQEAMGALSWTVGSAARS